MTHYTYQHDNDYHINIQQSPIIIEKKWDTSYWPGDVFLFLIGMMEVKTLLGLTNIYGHKTIENIEPCRKLSKALLNNTYQLDEKEKYKN